MVLAANTLTWVLEGVRVAATTGNGALNGNTSDNVDLLMDGTVFGESRGVFLQSATTQDFHSPTVGATGQVPGNAGFGAVVEGADAAVVNHGHIGVIPGVGLRTSGARAQVRNFGTITSTSVNGATSAGVRMEATGSELVNFGTIAANGAGGMGVDLASAAQGRVESHGTITGTAFAINGSAAADVVINTGSLVGGVNLGNLTDLFEGAGGRRRWCWAVRAMTRSGAATGTTRSWVGRTRMRWRDGGARTSWWATRAATPCAAAAGMTR